MLKKKQQLQVKTLCNYILLKKKMFCFCFFFKVYGCDNDNIKPYPKRKTKKKTKKKRRVGKKERKKQQ